MPADRIELTTPIGRDWEAVIRMILGGIADRLDLGFDELDDLQLAVERLLAEGDPQDPGTLSFQLLDPGGRTRGGAAARATARQPAPPRAAGAAPRPGRADAAAHPADRGRLLRRRGGRGR